MLIHLGCGIALDGAFDAEGSTLLVDGVAGDGYRLREAAYVVGVVVHSDGAFLTRHNGLLSILRGCATAAGLNALKDKGLVAIVPEDKLAVAVASLLDGAILMLKLLEADLGTVFGYVFLLGRLCASDESHGRKQANHCKLLHHYWYLIVCFSACLSVIIASFLLYFSGCKITNFLVLCGTFLLHRFDK